MKFFNYFFLLIISFIIISISPKALTDNCSNKENLELQKAASQVKIGYTYKNVTDTSLLNNKSVEFTININNMSDNIYIDVFGIPTVLKSTYYKSNEIAGVISIGNLPSYTQNTYTLQIKSNNYNCKDKLIVSKQIVTPKYNEFSESSECKEYPKFSLCQKFYNTSVTYEEFLSKLNNYIDSLNQVKKTSSIEKKEEEKKTVDYLKEVFNQNKKVLLYILLSIIVVVLIIGIIVVIRKKLIIK